MRNERSDSEEYGNVSAIAGETNEIIANVPVGRSGWDYGEVAVDETAREVAGNLHLHILYADGSWEQH